MVFVMDKLWNTKCILEEKLAFAEQQNKSLRLMLASETSKTDRMKEQFNIYRVVMAEEVFFYQSTPLNR